jgi:transcriptional regulator with PAS, ATPase and Fis domain
MKNILVSWVGGHDITSIDTVGIDRGPIISTLSVNQFDKVYLLYNYSDAKVTPYIEWLKTQVDGQIEAAYTELESPIHFGDIYKSASQLLASVTSIQPDCKLNILLSPGTPAMQAVWILLAKTQYSVTFWQSSKEQGVQEAIIPFEISAEYLPAAEQIGTGALKHLAAANVPVDAAFDDIITQNPHMLELKGQATILAERDVPVLIYGESGTGKELFARAIHNASPRASNNFIAVNCGAFPAELVDSILFGHKKGAFTGATADKRGVFEQANGGTLFLDEFGELEPQVQVRLLRVLQDGTYTPIGGAKEERVDVRIITATNKDLMVEMAEGRFREDLFYRVAVGVLHLPPIHERKGDLSLLADRILAVIGDSDDHLKDKNISVEAKNLILKHSWPGNVRELHSTLLRAALWSQTNMLSAENIKQALFNMPEKQSDVLGRDISQGIDIAGVIADVSSHYISRAMAESGGKKSKAAKLLGLNSYQTLNSWIEKYDIK